MKNELEAIAQPLMNEGNALLEQKKYTEAIAKYSKVIQSSPNYVPALRKLALSHTMLDQLGQAVNIYKRVVKLKPKDTQIKAKLSKVLSRQGKEFSKQGNLLKAIEIYQKVITLQPEQSEIFYTSFGDALKQNNKINEAIEAYKKAVELNPENRKACLGLGRAYLAKAKLMPTPSTKESA